MSTVPKVEFCEEENYSHSSISGHPPLKKQKNNSNVLICNYPSIKPSGEKQESRLSALSKRKILPNKYVHAPSLWSLGIHEELPDKLEKIGWADLMIMNEPSYETLTREFLSSFEASKEGTLSFRIGNVQHDISRSTLAGMFGWEIVEQQVLPKDYATPLWLRITGLPKTEKYKTHCAAASEMISSTYRYFHRLMTYTIYGRAESNNKVQKGELLLMYHFDAGMPVDWTSLLIERFIYQATKSSGPIVMGGFVTRIAERLGVFDCHKTSLKEVEGWSCAIDNDYLFGMKLLYCTKNGFVGPIHHKRDPQRVVEEDATECESEKDNTLVEQVAQLQRGQAELQSSQVQILKSQERMEKQLADILAYMQRHFARPAL